jgi:hypothetical protein
VTGRAIFVGAVPPAAPQPPGSDPFCARLERLDDSLVDQVQADAEAPLIDLRHVVAGAAGNPLTLRCDVHPWMTAYLWVLENPFFAVTAEDGSFAINNLSAGDYTLEAWHERLGTRRARLTIAPAAGPAKSAHAEFRFTLDTSAPAGG